jgi:UDP-3-O-[3-hydroxymyristoyl] glucosamine N-acyltransferase
LQSKKLTIAEIAEIVGGELVGEGSRSIDRIASLDQATADSVSFLSNPKFEHQLNTTLAGCVLLSDKYDKVFNSPHILCKDPYLAFAKVSQALDPSPLPAYGISPQSVVHESAAIGKNVSIGAGAVIDADCTIADNVCIGVNSYIGRGSSLGINTKLFANVSVYHGVKLGADCIIHSGTVIGSDGFGYANDKGRWVKIPQIGGVTIGNRVEIGANSTIDRGALNETIIHDGVVIDNLCHIAHNVEIGEDTAMAAHSGIAGSTVVGKGCTFSGRTSIIGHLELAAGTHVTAGTLISKSNDKPAVFSSGTGTQENKTWRRNVARFKQLDEMAKKLRQLEKKLQSYEAKKSDGK